jgi:multidrug efflux pump subunit AcrA (membrane-fusion protein)
VLVDNAVINARLRSVGQDVDSQTLTVLAVLNLPDDQPVRVGQTVALQLEEEVASLGGWLPITALLEGDKGLWTVLVVRQDGDGSTVTVRESVEVIFNRSDRVFVKGTLTDGDSVVSGGMQRLSPGAPVEVVPAIRVTN